MGIAAYNRGTALVSRQLSEKLPDHNSAVVSAINELPRGDAKLFGPTVVRMLPGKGRSRWALMNRQEGGFASSCYEYKSLRELFARWNIHVVGYGRDKHSFFYEVA